MPLAADGLLLPLRALFMLPERLSGVSRVPFLRPLVQFLPVCGPKCRQLAECWDLGIRGTEFKECWGSLSYLLDDGVGKFLP